MGKPPSEGPRYATLRATPSNLAIPAMPTAMPTAMATAMPTGMPGAWGGQPMIMMQPGAGMQMASWGGQPVFMMQRPPASMQPMFMMQAPMGPGQPQQMMKLVPMAWNPMAAAPGPYLPYTDMQHDMDGDCMADMHPVPVAKRPKRDTPMPTTAADAPAHHQQQPPAQLMQALPNQSFGLPVGLHLPTMQQPMAVPLLQLQQPPRQKATAAAPLHQHQLPQQKVQQLLTARHAQVLQQPPQQKLVVPQQQVQLQAQQPATVQPYVQPYVQQAQQQQRQAIASVADTMAAATTGLLRAAMRAGGRKPKRAARKTRKVTESDDEEEEAPVGDEGEDVDEEGEAVYVSAAGEGEAVGLDDDWSVQRLVPNCDLCSTDEEEEEQEGRQRRAGDRAMRKPKRRNMVNGALQPLIAQDVRGQADGSVVVKAMCPFGLFEGTLTLMPEGAKEKGKRKW